MGRDLFQQPNRRDRVLHLVAAAQRQRHPVVGRTGRHERQLRASIGHGRLDGDTLRREDVARSGLGTGAADDVLHHRRVRREDRDRAALDHASLLGGDGGQGLPEVRLVIEIDCRDRGGRCIDGIGGVEPAAEPHLEHRDINLGIAERFQRERRRGFEERGRRGEPVGGDADPSCEVLEVRAADGPAVDRDPLGQTDEMGRRVSARAIPGRAQAPFEHGRDRSLAVGARDHNRSKRLFRPSERREQSANLMEAELDAQLFEREQVGGM